MSAKSSYEIVETALRGKIVLATKDFLPGEVVLEEKEPLLFLPEECLKEDQNRILFESFSVVMKKLEQEKREKLLTLYGPTTGIANDIVRMFASSDHVLFSPDDVSAPRRLTPNEVELFVKVGSIVRLNAFGAEEGKLLFSEITRFSHSCAANCSYSIAGKSICCRTKQSVKQGDELTISYVCERDTQPTPVRRHRYLETKEFTCHCARCNALGDDTRQFDCVDPACRGVMMACEPINKDEVRFTGLPYTGVTYVEPHLLPCTVCHRTALRAYQTQMFALETRLPVLAAQFAQKQVSLVGKPDLGFDRYEPLLKEMKDLTLPHRHQMVVLNTLMKIHRYTFMCHAKQWVRGDAEASRAVAQHAATEYIAAQEGVTPGVHRALLDVLYNTCHDCIIELQNPLMGMQYVFPPVQAKELLQRTLRMWLIYFDRDTRKTDLDVALLKTLEALPNSASTGSVVSLELCAFCEESPLCAALSLSRCGRCRQVCYCSAGCQKAHWKLHKKSCKKV